MRDKDAIKLFLSLLKACSPTTTLVVLTLADGIEEIYKSTAIYAEKDNLCYSFGVDGAEQI